MRREGIAPSADVYPDGSIGGKSRVGLLRFQTEGAAGRKRQA